MMDSNNVLVLCDNKEWVALDHDMESVGYDVYAVESTTLPARSRASVNTHLRIAMPNNLAGRIVSRSGLSFRHGSEVGAGLIDPSFRGEIQVVLYNHSDVDYVISPGNRIAQIVFFSYVNPTFLYVHSQDFPPSQRGEKGFGSSSK